MRISADQGYHHALPSRCSTLFGECFSDVLLPCDQFNDRHSTSQLTADPQVPTRASELLGTEAGATQAIEVTTNSSKAVWIASPLGCWNCCGRRRSSDSVYIHAAITVAHPIPMAAGDCPEDFQGGSRRGPRRSIWPEIDGVPAVRLQQIRVSLPHRIGGSTCRKPARRLRDLSLQLRRHARLGLLSDQHRAFETRRGQSSRPAGLQSQHRLRLQAVYGAGL